MTATIITEAKTIGRTVAIERTANRKNGRDLFLVKLYMTRPASGKYVGVTWSQHDSEADARNSANKAWTREMGRETMISAG